MKRTVVSIVLVGAVITVLGLLAVRVRVGATADAVAVLQTAGMTCSSCSAAISQTLQRVKGVAATEVDVEAGYVAVGYDTKAVTPEKLAGSVTQSGYASTVSRVMSPAEFRQLVGRDIGQKGQGQGCCGSGTCGMKQNS